MTIRCFSCSRAGTTARRSTSSICELAAFYPQIAVAYTQMVTISTDEHHALQEFRASVGAQWPFLSDPERTVQRDLDIKEYTDPEHDPMIPHTLVLKPGLVIHSIYNGYWFWGRPSVEDLRQDLRAVTREIRPDWDLVDPALRKAWDSDDLSMFHGWRTWSPNGSQRRASAFAAGRRRRLWEPSRGDRRAVSSRPRRVAAVVIRKPRTGGSPCSSTRSRTCSRSR